MILERIKTNNDLKMLRVELLPQLALEIRTKIVETVSKTGGHLAPSLGAADFIIALHYVYNSPIDRIIFDVGHQAYAHKLLTGRLNNFHTIRQFGGLSGFPLIEESEHDIFSAGHASVAISQGAGLVCARAAQNAEQGTTGGQKVIVIIGDASLSGGMAFEALNHIGHLGHEITIIINDNEMSISKNVGAISQYLNSLITTPAYNKIKGRIDEYLRGIPKFGRTIFNISNRVEEALKGLIIDGLLFEELGFRYFGPFDGHNIPQLIHTFNDLKNVDGPKIIHLITKKGKGYKPAEKDPSKFHGTSAFHIPTAEPLKTSNIYKDVLKKKIVMLAEKDPAVAAVTAAMAGGTGLDEFAEKFPARFFDVGIAEQHAMTLSSGLAKGGMKVFCALYSTFLQRAVDQLIHDTALQKSPVRLMIDRAGLVGDDGVTHQGLFDISLIRVVPNIVFMAPRNPDEFVKMINFVYHYEEGPSVIRYPREQINLDSVRFEQDGAVILGKGEQLREGRHLTLLGSGPMVNMLQEVAEELAKAKITSDLIDARFIKPLDEKLISASVQKTGHLLTLEDNYIAGGFGSAVIEMLSKHQIFPKFTFLGFGDYFVQHGKIDLLRKHHEITVEHIIARAKTLIEKK